MRTLIALSLMLSGVSFASTVNLQLATEPGQWSTLTSTLAITHPGFDQSDSLNYSQAIITSGPVRSGFLQIQTGGGSGYFELGSATLTSGFAGGPITMNDNGNIVPVTVEVTCSANSGECLPGNGYYTHYIIIPVTLGTPMTLESIGSTHYTDVVGGYYPGGGSLTSVFQFRFLEPPFNIREFGHNLQPVLATETPEPSTWGMLLVAAGLGILKLRKQWR